jgi:hypothetical protein
MKSNILAFTLSLTTALVSLNSVHATEAYVPLEKTANAAFEAYFSGAHSHTVIKVGRITHISIEGREKEVGNACTVTIQRETRTDDIDDGDRMNPGYVKITASSFTYVEEGEQVVNVDRMNLIENNLGSSVNYIEDVIIDRDNLRITKVEVNTEQDYSKDTVLSVVREHGLLKKVSIYNGFSSHDHDAREQVIECSL